jgi:hypothetical protein
MQPSQYRNDRRDGSTTASGASFSQWQGNNLFAASIGLPASAVERLASFRALGPRELSTVACERAAAPLLIALPLSLHNRPFICQNLLVVANPLPTEAGCHYNQCRYLSSDGSAVMNL